MARQFLKRLRDTRRPCKLVRIYTEGKETEPNYFKAIRKELRLAQIDIKIHGQGDHTLPLVEFVLQEKASSSKGTDDETEWWVVFDRDDHEYFDKAIKIAEAGGVNVACSNEAFELWYILHFEYLDTSIGRVKFQSKLTKLLGRKYEKSDPKVYDDIRNNEANAIRNARRLEKEHDKLGVKSHRDRDPSTSVYKLVEYLRSLNK